MENYTPKQIAQKIQEAIDRKKSGDKNYIEWHDTVYDDGIWRINVELHPYGLVRWWVSREDKYGYYMNTMVNVYKYNNELKYSAEFPIKKKVIEKLLAVYKYIDLD